VLVPLDNVNQPDAVKGYNVRYNGSSPAVKGFKQLVWFFLDVRYLNRSAMISCKTPIQKPKTTQALSLPNKLTEILPLCEAFKRKRRNSKIETDDWHLLCHQNGGFNRWQKQQDFPARFNAPEFSALSARTYLALAELDLSHIPHFAPFSVRDAVKWANQSKLILPRNIPLPGAANQPLFWQGLFDLQRWKPSDLPKGTTGHGDPCGDG